MKKIVISPYAAKLRSGNRNPKDYCYWNELVKLLKDNGKYIVQIGVQGENRIDGTDEMIINLSVCELEKLIIDCKISNSIIISVDSFFPHMCNYYEMQSVVIWSQSDPNIFGYSKNLNLLKDRKYLRKDQFLFWENVPYIKEAFMNPEEIMSNLKNWKYFNNTIETE